MTIQQLQQYRMGDRGILFYDKITKLISPVRSINCDSTFLIKNHLMSVHKIVYTTLDILPILYPISCLTQEIEVYGERFVPAIEIAKRVDNRHNSLSIIKQYTGMIVVKTDKVDDVENVSIRYANGEIISVCRSVTPILLSTCIDIIQLLQSWFINYQGIEAVNPFDLEVNPYK